MRENVPELVFSLREAFRVWLGENAETSEGVWLVFGKTKAVVTLSTAEALEEALCHGWIDGQMESLDGTKYRKYFARRRAKSVWSEKNKKIAEALQAKGLMTALGEKAVADAKQNGAWDAPKSEPVTDAQAEAFAEKLAGFSPAHENFMKMPPSVRRTCTRRYLSHKSEDARERDFVKIVERLNQNLKPM